MVIGQVHQVVRKAFIKAFNVQPPKFDIEFAKHKMFGDFSSNIAMVSATDLDTTPMNVAQKIVQELESSEVFKGVSVTTPGFINFTVTDEYLTEAIKEIIRHPDAYGRSDLGKEIRVL